MKIATEHVKFCIELYRTQLNEGRYFLHEHPCSASSWEMPGIIELAAECDVDISTFDMCAYGLTVVDKDGEALAEKCTKVM